ncbi:hypothetical protein HID58_061986 [Brassica napus]|uniref:Secreted protein n=1 Tax=Brassica napus TaxID=3708 RepID=A0ABQ8A051_BRANA|nr:hypothetical protein HID58_061986 [Brassica napus]
MVPFDAVLLWCFDEVLGDVEAVAFRSPLRPLPSPPFGFAGGGYQVLHSCVVSVYLRQSSLALGLQCSLASHRWRA